MSDYRVSVGVVAFVVNQPRNGGFLFALLMLTIVYVIVVHTKH